MARSLVGIHTYGFMPHWRSCFGSYQFGDVDKSTVELLFDPTYQGRRIVVADYATRSFTSGPCHRISQKSDREWCCRGRFVNGVNFRDAAK